VRYPFEILADPDGTYVIRFPDLPGCMTQVESLEEIPAMAEEIRTLWIETEYDLGHDIPLPSCQQEHSGKFNVRLPRSLHRSLAEAAEREGVSLNHYVSDLLARGDAQARVERRIAELAKQIEALSDTHSPNASATSRGRERVLGMHRAD
jgi:antitoxin HicB